MLELKHLTAGYRRGELILKDVTLTAPAGAITALLGANGAGKSTLFKAVLQEIRYTGTVFCDKTDLATLRPLDRAARVSLLPQHLPAPALSLRETAALGLSLRMARLGTREWAQVDAALARVGLLPLADRGVNTLSGGERQRAFLAMLLAQDTPVLLLDEPTAHIDPAFTARFFEILREERGKGKAILLVTHDVNEALTHADRVAVLEDGTLAFTGTVNEALAQEIPEKHFGLARYVAKRGEKTAVFFKAE